ncbi:hypothetical protein H1R20_g12829, partial [Candolleomyces eurysporus]
MDGVEAAEASPTWAGIRAIEPRSPSRRAGTLSGEQDDALLDRRTIRKSWLEWNNFWVFGAYGLPFGRALPLLVGRWWFGNHQKTKDGIHASRLPPSSSRPRRKQQRRRSSALSARRSSGKSPNPRMLSLLVELHELEKMIPQKVGQQYAEVRKLTRDVDGEFHVSRRRALILIYAHLTRLPIKITSLQNDSSPPPQRPPQRVGCSQPAYTHSWHHAIELGRSSSATHAPPRVRLTQLPGVSEADIDSFAPRPREMTEVLSALEEKGDGRAGTVRKPISKWGRVEIVDAAFKVIGERVVTPSSIIFLVVKLRLTPPGSNTERKAVSVDEAKRIVQYNDKKDEEFLLSKQDAEDLSKGRSTGWAHSLIPSTCISVPLVR